MTPGEFRRYRLAENRRAEIAQPLDHPGVGSGHAILVDLRSIGGRHVRSRDDVLDRDWNARQRAWPPRDIDGKIFERLEHRLDGFRLLQASCCVSVRCGLIVFEQSQEFEHPRAGWGCGACGGVSHAGRS
jgi:hypothetical protein